MANPRPGFVYRNLANATSLLGVLPLIVLFLDDGYRYLIPLILFNNIMDDLNGVLASKLNIRSRFGGDLDNICDAVAHVVLALAVGAHFGGLVAAASLVAAGSIILRVTTRINPDTFSGTGSPTNELMRHMLFVLLLAGQFDFEPDYLLIPMFLLHSASLLAPFRMPAMLRSRAQSAAMVGLVNVALVTAWLLPPVTPVIAAAFIGAYLYAFVAGARNWMKNKNSEI